MSKFMMSERTLLRLIESTIRGFSNVGSFVFLPCLIAVSVYDIVGRQFFNTGSTRLQELQWHFFFASVMLGLGWTYLQDRHVRNDIISSRLTPRTRACIEVLGFVFIVLPLSIVLVRFGTEAAWNSWASGERARASLGLSYRWVIKSAMPLGALLLLFAAGVGCWRNVKRLRGIPDEPAP